MIFRYSKLKLIYDLLDLIKKNLFMIIILFILNVGNQSMITEIVRWVVVGILAISLLSRIHETFFMKVVFADDGIHIHKGLISKSERFIPRDKFENVQTKVNVLQRLFGTQSITLETGETTSDLELKFVRKAFSNKIEDYVLQNTNGKQDAEDTINTLERQILFTPTIRDILKASLLSFSFLAIIPISFKIWSDIHPEDYVNVDEDITNIPLWLLILLIFIVVLIAVGIGVFKTFNQYYQYTISMDDEHIYVQKGWLSKQSLSIRKEKVQAVIYKQSGFQKLLGVTTIKLISAGEILESEDQSINEFFPYLPTKKAHDLLETMLPEYHLREMTHHASPKAKKLIWLRPPLFACLVAIIGFWKPIFFIFGAVVFVFTYINRIREYRNTAFRLEDTHVQLCSGAFTVETLVTKRAKLLELKFKRSLLQRMCGVMSVSLTNRAHPVHVTTLLDIDPILQPMITTWFEERTKDVVIDPYSQNSKIK